MVVAFEIDIMKLIYWHELVNCYSFEWVTMLKLLVYVSLTGIVVSFYQYTFVCVQILHFLFLC